MPDCLVPWGHEQLKLPMPAHWTLAQLAQPRYRPAPPDWLDRLGLALARAEGLTPLAQLARAIPAGGRVVLVIEDFASPNPLPQILARIVRELEHAGVGDEQIELLIATGVRPLPSAARVRHEVGPLAERLAWRANDCRNRQAHARIGQVPSPKGRGDVDVLLDRRCMQADLRIVIAGVRPHPQAGFSGGAQVLATGVSYVDTLARLHRLGLGPQAPPMMGTQPAQNPMRVMIDAIGDLVDAAHGQTFGVQYLTDQAGLPSAIVTGSLRRGQHMLAKQCALAAGVAIEQPADILIVNAAPHDQDLWQSLQAVPNTRQAVRPNGVILLLARCPDGLNMPTPRWAISPAWARRAVHSFGPQRLLSLLTRVLPQADHEARFHLRQALETLHRNPVLVYSPRLAASAAQAPGLTILGDLAQAFAAADAMLTKGSRRAIVFPMGGISFPVVSGI